MFGLLSYEDIWVAGIGFDIAGAFLLAKGLLLSPRQILSLSASYFGFSAPEIVARVEDRVSTSVGVGALVVGFLFQLIGYVVDLAVRSAPPASLARAGVAVVVAVVAVGFVMIVYRVTRPGWRKRLLLDVAHYRGSDRQQHPYGAYLLAFGPHIGLPIPLDGESQAQYASRVWQVTEIIEGGPP